MFFVDAIQFCFQFGAVFLPIYLLHFGAQACNLLHFGAYHFLMDSDMVLLTFT